MDFIDAMKIRKRIKDKCIKRDIDCYDCPLGVQENDDIEIEYVCGEEDLMYYDPEEYVKRIDEWNKKNPTITNLQKLNEIIKQTFDTTKEEIYVGYNNIMFTEKFANKEYVPKKL